MSRVSRHEYKTAEIIDSTDIDEQPLTDEQLEEAAIKRRHTINVALVGNPNCGKTSLFNFASGAQRACGQLLWRNSLMRRLDTLNTKVISLIL